MLAHIKGSVLACVVFKEGFLEEVAFRLTSADHLHSNLHSVTDEKLYPGQIF